MDQAVSTHINSIERPIIMDRRRVLRHPAAPALALAVVITLPTTRPAKAPATVPPPEFRPVSVTYGGQHGTTVKGQFLSYNDFHGAIDPPGGSGAVVNASGTST